MAKKLLDDDLLYLFPVQKLFYMIYCIFFLFDFRQIGICFFLRNHQKCQKWDLNS